MLTSRILGAMALAAVLSASPLIAQYPDLLYYKFDGPAAATVPNLANGAGVPASGSIFGGHAMGVTGQFNGGLRFGGGTGATDYVDTGWVTNLGASSWTMSLWLDMTGAAPTTGIGYFLGDGTAGSWRAFINGAAGAGNAILRGPHADVILPGAAVQTSGHVLAWVHDATAGVIKGFLDGALVATTSVAALNIVGTTPFRVGAYTTSTGMPAGTVLDEFRLFGFALTDGEIAALSAVELFDRNVLSITQTGPGIGDLIIGLGNKSSTGARGYTFLSATTSLPVGGGPLLGIVPDALTWTTLTFPYFPGNLFHFDGRDSGVWPSAPILFPPGTFTTSTGLTLDAVLVMLNAAGGFDSRSNVARITFQ